MTTKGFPRKMALLMSLRSEPKQNANPRRTRPSTPSKLLSTPRPASSNPKALLLPWHLTLMMDVMVSHLALPMQAMVTPVMLVKLTVMSVAMVVVEMAVAEMVVADD